MQLVLGTYERFLLGYKLPDELQEGCQLQRSFTHAAHQGPVRCLDAAGAYVVSGGQDDQLHIYDVKRNHDLGFMMNPGDGAIPCIKFFTPAGAQNPTHLFSGSDDGSIAVWKAGGGWEHLKLMRGHKGPVRSLSIHPSGLLALSVGHDRALRMWNLAKGRCSYTAKLEAEADYIGFSANGESYALLCDKLVSIHSVGQEGSVIAKLQHQRRAVSVLQQQDGTAVITGLDDGRLCYWDLRAAQQPVWEYEKAHNARIRSIVALSPEPQSVSGLPQHLATASSDGVVKIWDSRALTANGSSSSGGGSSSRLQQLASVSTSGRITGMVLSAPDRTTVAAAAVVGGGGAAAAAGAKGASKHRQKLKKQKKEQQKDQQQVADVGMQQQQQQEIQPHKQQQQQPGNSGASHTAAKQQQSQQKKQKMKKKQHGITPDENALVPRVQTKIKKKRKKPNKEQMQKAIAAAVGGSKASKASNQQGLLKHKKRKQ